jgi:hypothetical protein
MVASGIEEELRDDDTVWLTGLVRQALGRPAADLVAWYTQRIGTGRGSATAGLYRLAGSAQDPDGLWHGSLIVKAVASAPLASDDVTHPLYWQREVMAYRSGLLGDLPSDCRPARRLVLAVAGGCARALRSRVASRAIPDRSAGVGTF